MPRKKKKSFSGTVRVYVAKSNRRMLAVFQQSVQDVARISNEPVAQGGRMRVDTGFLRNSQVANIGTMPSGPSNPKTDSPGNADDVAMVIAGATVKDVVFVGWSANYAKYREYKDGFVEGAAKKWRRIVQANSQRAKKEIN